MCDFFQPDNRNDKPYIRIATGNYLTDLEKFGSDETLALILENISHELTYYFQWINNIKLTEIGYERQASAYAGCILDEYADVVESP